VDRKTSENTPLSIDQQLEFANEIPDFNAEGLNSTQKTLPEALQGSWRRDGKETINRDGQKATTFTLYYDAGLIASEYTLMEQLKQIHPSML